MSLLIKYWVKSLWRWGPRVRWWIVSISVGKKTKLLIGSKYKLELGLFTHNLCLAHFYTYFGDWSIEYSWAYAGGSTKFNLQSSIRYFYTMHVCTIFEALLWLLIFLKYFLFLLEYKLIKLNESCMQISSSTILYTFKGQNFCIYISLEMG
jgi:hypothetical protein